MKTLTVFFWHNSTGYDHKTRTFSKEFIKPILMCGSDGSIRLDARLNKSNLDAKAKELLNRIRRLHSDIIGYSIGYSIQSNYSYNQEQEAQRVQKLTLI